MTTLSKNCAAQPGLECGGTPGLMNFFRTSKRKPKGYAAFVAQYRRAFALCGSLRSTPADGAVTGYLIERNPAEMVALGAHGRFTDLSCYWGNRTHVHSAGVTLGIAIPDPGTTIPTGPCVASDGACRRIRDGKISRAPFNGSDGTQAIETTVGWVSTNRAAKSEAEYNQDARLDLALLYEVARVLRIPTR